VRRREKERCINIISSFLLVLGKELSGKKKIDIDYENYVVCSVAQTDTI